MMLWLCKRCARECREHFPDQRLSMLDADRMIDCDRCRDHSMVTPYSLEETMDTVRFYQFCTKSFSWKGLYMLECVRHEL